VIAYLSKEYPTGVQEYSTGISTVDFYIPEKNLWVEIDGSVHYYGLS
jgi:hypothetical protein